jgi:hypothetical protein
MQGAFGDLPSLLPRIPPLLALKFEGVTHKRTLGERFVLVGQGRTLQILNFSLQIFFPPKGEKMYSCPFGEYIPSIREE